MEGDVVSTVEIGEGAWEIEIDILGPHAAGTV